MTDKTETQILNADGAPAATPKDPRITIPMDGEGDVATTDATTARESVLHRLDPDVLTEKVPEWRGVVMGAHPQLKYALLPAFLPQHTEVGDKLVVNVSTKPDVYDDIMFEVVDAGAFLHDHSRAIFLIQRI